MTNEELRNQISEYIDLLTSARMVIIENTGVAESAFSNINEFSDDVERKLKNIVALFPTLNIAPLKKAMNDMNHSMPSDYELDRGLQAELFELSNSLQKIQSELTTRPEPTLDNRNLDVTGDLDTKHREE